MLAVLNVVYATGATYHTISSSRFFAIIKRLNKGAADLFNHKRVIFFLGLGQRSPLSTKAMQGAVVQIVMQACGKITLLLSASSIYLQAHLRKVSELDGQRGEMPEVFAPFYWGAVNYRHSTNWSKLVKIDVYARGYRIVSLFYSCSLGFFDHPTGFYHYYCSFMLIWLHLLSHHDR